MIEEQNRCVFRYGFKSIEVFVIGYWLLDGEKMGSKFFIYKIKQYKNKEFESRDRILYSKIKLDECLLSC